MHKEIDLLIKRGFGAISLMIEPMTTQDNLRDIVWGGCDIYFSAVHKLYKSEMRFLFKSGDWKCACEMVNKLVKIYDDKRGDVWELPNDKRIALNLLPPEKLYIQGTSNGFKIAREQFGLTIHGQEETRPTARPDRQDPSHTT